MTERLRVRGRFAGSSEDEEGLSHERLWAVPIKADTYRLASSSFAAPLAAGDVVRAAPDTAGRLQRVDAAEPCDRCSPSSRRTSR